MALAAAMLTGCASGYSGDSYYPDEAYYDGPYDPYYGGGYGSFYDDDGHDRYFHPARDVSCDRVRDICYDRYGPSYFATARYLGEGDANRAYKKYGDSVFLFSPRPGVSCDRRTKECSDGDWTNRADPLKRLEPGNPGSVGSATGFDDDDDLPVRRIAPARRTDDDAAPQRAKPRFEAPPPMADSNGDDDVARPAQRVRPEQPQALPRMNSNDKVRNGGADSACPPRGCTD